jgi:hypothetical protein
VVRSCLGGLDDRFVLTGSEECRVYVYHRHTGGGLAAVSACGLSWLCDASGSP